MNYVENTKDDINAEVLFRCTGDLADSIDKQSRATHKVNDSLNNLNSKIDSLEKAFTKASESSGLVTKSLNRLTLALVLVGVGQLLVGIYEIF